MTALAGPAILHPVCNSGGLRPVSAHETAGPGRQAAGAPDPTGRRCRAVDLLPSPYKEKPMSFKRCLRPIVILCALMCVLAGVLQAAVAWASGPFQVLSTTATHFENLQYVEIRAA